MTKMRAKMLVRQVQVHSNAGVTQSETLQMNAVCPAEGYPADGSDEDNTFAKWTPNASVSIQITNPELFDKFHIGQAYYVDFSPAE